MSVCVVPQVLSDKQIVYFALLNFSFSILFSEHAAADTVNRLCMIDTI
jgi:hypothetical protein